MFNHKSFSRKSFKPESWAPFEIFLPPVAEGGGGGGAAGYKLPSSIEYEDRIRAEIIREDEEILAVLVGAVTSGAMVWLH